MKGAALKLNSRKEQLLWV